MLKFFRLVTERPYLLLLSILLVTGLFSIRLATHGLPSDNSPKSLIVSDDEEARRYREANELFGDDQVVVVALETDDIFIPPVIGQIRELTEGFSAIPGVRQVVSITNVQSAKEEGDEIRVGRLIPLRADDTQLRRIGDEALQDRLLVGNLIARDRQMAAINIFLKRDAPNRAETVLARIRNLADQHAGPARIYYAGLPYMEARNSLHIRRDLGTFAPFTVVLILVTFFLSFRSWRGVLMPLGTVAIGLIWTFGVMSLAGRPLTVITMMVPVIIMAIGSSFVIHVINQYYIVASGKTALAEANGRGRIVRDAMDFIAPPVLVSGGTTMAGFGSLVFTDIIGSHDMGLFSATGIAATTILSLTLVPAWLTLLPPPRPSANTAGAANRGIDAMLRRLGRWASERRAIIVAVAFATLLAGGIGAARLRVDSDLLNFYPERSEERVGADKLREHLGGAAAFQVIVDGGAQGDMRRIDALQRLEELQRFLSSVPGIDSTFSVVDLVKMAGRFTSQARPGLGEIPKDQASVDTILDRYLSGGDSGDMPVRLISPDGRKAQVIVRSHLFGSSAMRESLARIEQWGRQNLPSGFRLYPTGILVLLNRTSDSVAADQARSLAVALTLIFIMMIALFRSLRLGLIALIPNLVPIVMFFGFMGWTGIALNLNTSLVASIVLGLAVDNAVHLIRRYTVLRPSSPDRASAMRESLRLTGRPVIFANATLAFAFSIFALSSFLPIRTGGLLSGVTILACMIADLTLLPVMLTSNYARLEPAQALECAA